MSNPVPFSVIIPAAGNSERMGSDKALLQHTNGTTFAENLLVNYTEAGADTVVIVVNKSFDLLQIKSRSSVCVVNDHVEYGRSYSIKLGIQHIPAGNACFIQNIDNPCIDQNLLWALLYAVKDDAYVIPVSKGRGGHPVLLGKGIVRTMINKDPFVDFREVLKKFHRIEILWEDPGILLNINTSEDYLKFKDGQ